MPRIQALISGFTILSGQPGEGCKSLLRQYRKQPSCKPLAQSFDRQEEPQSRGFRRLGALTDPAEHDPQRYAAPIILRYSVRSWWSSAHASPMRAGESLSAHHLVVRRMSRRLASEAQRAARLDVISVESRSTKRVLQSHGHSPNRSTPARMVKSNCSRKPARWQGNFWAELALGSNL